MPTSGEEFAESNLVFAAPQEQEPFGTVDITLAENTLGAKQRGHTQCSPPACVFVSSLF